MRESLPSGFPSPAPGARAGTTFVGLLGYVREVFVAPFRADPTTVLTRTLAQRDHDRRAALLRLIVGALTVLQLVALPGTISSHPPLIVLETGVLVIALGVACLLLNALGRTTLASLIYVIGVFGLAFNNVAQNPGGIDARSILILALMPAFIVLTGLLLPRWAVWLALALSIVATLSALAFFPVARALSDTLGSREQVRVVIGALLALVCAVTAILTWIFARSSRAGMEAVTRAFERERELAELKDQFIVDANHELRTPIMSLCGNLEVLALLGDRATPEQTARMLKRAQISGDAVLRLLGSVLDAGALGATSPQLEVRPLRLAPLVTEVLETFDPREVGEPGLVESATKSRDVRVHVSPTLVVLADDGRVRQILTNLVANALKYSEPGTSLAIVAEPQAAPPSRPLLALRQRAPSAAAYALITVRDFGLGVPPQDAHRLFNRFVRLERDIASSVRGTGVGLYMCRVLVEAMGGRIWVTSSGVPGEGSTFSFTLPLAHSAAAPYTGTGAQTFPGGLSVEAR